MAIKKRQLGNLIESANLQLDDASINLLTQASAEVEEPVASAR